MEPSGGRLLGRLVQYARSVPRVGVVAPAQHVSSRGGGGRGCHGREMSTEVLKYGVRVTPNMQINDAVKRVLSLDNCSRAQKIKCEKQRVVEQTQERPGDTGSPEVQIAALTVSIKALHEHISVHHPKDHASKRSYTVLVTRRRKMLQYLKRKDFERYSKVAREQGLR